MKARGREAKEILNFWLNKANTCGWNEDGTKFDYKGINDALDSLEVMLLIYNIFAEVPLQLKKNENTGIYKLASL